LILLRNPKWGPIWWLAYYIPRLSRASLCVSWAFLFYVLTTDHLTVKTYRCLLKFIFSRSLRFV